MISVSVRVLIAAAAVAFVPTAGAQGFPSKPLRIIVPYSPGGIVDIVARTVAPKLAMNMGQPVIIDNRPGAAGAVAMDAFKQSLADGHTLVLADPALVINPLLQPRLSYRATRDIRAVTNFGSTGLMLAVHPSVPASDVQGLIRHSRTGGALNFSSPGIGTVPHLAGELFKVRTQANATHVPYKGGNAALADVLSGRIQMSFFTPPVALPYIRDGRLRGLAYTGAKRTAAAPQLPTMAEAGVPDFEGSVWLVFGVPPGTPADVVRQLNQALVDVSKMQDVRAALAQSDIPTIGSTPEEATRLIAQDEKRWALVIQTNNLRAD